jgi:hypothetical protein
MDLLLTSPHEVYKAFGAISGRVFTSFNSPTDKGPQSAYPINTSLDQLFQPNLLRKRLTATCNFRSAQD